MNCLNCQKETPLSKRRDKKRKFCCDKCANTYRARIRRGVVHEYKCCKACGNTFINTSKVHVYCSRRCKSRDFDSSIPKSIRNERTLKSRSRSPSAFIAGLLRKKELRFELSLEDVVTMYYAQDGKCALSGETMTYILNNGRIPTNISIDRIKTGGNYTIDNIRLVCSIVNVMRWTSTDDELRKWCKLILEYDNGKV